MNSQQFIALPVKSSRGDIGPNVRSLAAWHGVFLVKPPLGVSLKDADQFVMIAVESPYASMGLRPHADILQRHTARAAGDGHFCNVAPIDAGINKAARNARCLQNQKRIMQERE